MTFHCIRWRDRQRIATLLVANGWTRPYALDPNAGFMNRNTFTRGSYSVFLQSSRDVFIEYIPTASPDILPPHHGRGWRERTVAAIESVCASRG